MKLIIESDPKIKAHFNNNFNKIFSNLLNNAVKSNNFEAVECLLEKKAPYDSMIETPLETLGVTQKTWVYAIEKGYFKIAKLLIEQFKEGKFLKTTHGTEALSRTCLHLSSEGIKSTEIAKLLMERGASPFSHIKKMAPMELAINSWNFELVELFMKKGSHIKGEPYINFLFGFLGYK